LSTTHTIGIAGLKVAAKPDKIKTTLGSCIGVALFDRVEKVGGMAHVILPDSNSGSGDRGKFADTAVEALIQDVVQAGANSKRLIAKIAGGASMFGADDGSGLGRRNAEAVKQRLQEFKIRIAAEDIGGTKGRRMTMDPSTGQVEVMMIGAEASII
jgi:chemotaxis protein CheD